MPGWTPLGILVQDLRYALRDLAKTPGFAVTAILTLALGIGASTAVFTVVDSVLLQPLAYRDSGRLVTAWERVRHLGYEDEGPNPRHVDVWQKRATAFSGLTWLRHMGVGLSVANGHPRPVTAVACIPNLFDVLEVQPLLGRTFIPEDGTKGHDVAILTYSLWQSLFNGDPAAIGGTVRVDDTPRVVVGVLPANFHFPDGNALPAFHSKQPVSGAQEPSVFFTPALDITQFEWNGNYGNWVTIGRLEPGVTMRQAEAQLKAIQAQVSMEMPAGHGDHQPTSLSARLEPMQEAVVGESRTGLTLLLAAVGGLMLIACLNLASAQVGRALARSRDAAVRTALGAAKWRIVWTALAENLILAVVGGAVGFALASAGLDLLRAHSPVDIPRLSEIHLNTTVLLFAIGLMLAATFLSGLLPALKLIAADPHASLQQGGSRTLGSRGAGRVQAWLIGFQVFGCTALLLVTALFARSLFNLLSQDKGFETARISIAEVQLNPQSYSADQSRVQFDDAVLANLRAMPGVKSAALISRMPLQGESWIESVQRVDQPHRETPLINLRWASPGYFETTGQRLVAGRFLEERDRNLGSVVLSEREAKALWGDQNPIGGQVRIEGRTFTVIGVVADSRNASLKTAPPRMAYLHYKDRPPFPTYFLVRVAGSAESVLGGMRQAIWKYDPEVTVARVKTLDAQLADSLSTERFQTTVLLSFGAAALLLAMLGIYGVLNYSVVTRKREIGVRMALGASRASVCALTIAEAGAPVLAGLVAGLIATLAAGRVIRTLLYGVENVDALTALAVAALFISSAAAAAFLPARRAASIDPMDALRSE